MSTPEAVPPADRADVGRTDWTVPTMDDMRAKIDARTATATGQSELDQLSGVGQQQAQTVEQRDKAAQERLAAIRASLGND